MLQYNLLFRLIIQWKPSSFNLNEKKTQNHEFYKHFISNYSIKAPVSQSVYLFVCLFPPPKRRTSASWNFEGWFPGFRLKNIRIRPTVSRKIKKKNRACPVRPLWSLYPSNIRFKWTTKSTTARLYHYARYFPTKGPTNPDVF